MRATLLVVPASHPARTARLMLEHKGIPYRRIDLVPAFHHALVPLFGFSGSTVPALRLDDRHVQGSREIARALEEIRPEPALFPADPAQRARVEEAERWGEEVLQPMARRLPYFAMRRDRSEAGSFLEGARLGLPLPLASRMVLPVILLGSRLNAVTDEAGRADLAALPGALSEVDRLIGEGVIGGPAPNAADFQIGTSVRLLMTFADLHDAIAARPAGQLAMGLSPDYPGRVPRVLNAEERALALGAAA